jgi:hypothetical protein
MDWQPVKTAPSQARLICDESRRVQIGRMAGLRGYDDAGHLLSVVPPWWMPLPQGSNGREVRKGPRRKGRVIPL